MKSILQQDSSVLKAIEKAWNSCGCPAEFSICILSTEEKNFFGIVKKPAVISFSFLPEKRTKKILSDQKKGFDYKGKKIDLSNAKNIKTKKESYIKDRDKKELDPSFHVFWKKEYVDFVEESLKDIFRIIGFDSDFSFTVDNKMLNLFIDKKVLGDFEDEKMFFISMSNLLIQFLRKKFKKKFSSHYLIMHFKKS